MPELSCVMKNNQTVDLNDKLPDAMTLGGEEINAVQAITNLMRSKNYERWTRAALKGDCNEAYMITKCLYEDMAWYNAFKEWKDENIELPVTWVLMEEGATGQKYAVNITHWFISINKTDGDGFGTGAGDVTPALAENSNTTLNGYRDSIKDDIMDIETLREMLVEQGAPSRERIDEMGFQQYMLG